MTFTSWDMAIIFEMGHMIGVKSVKAQGLKAKPVESGQSHPEHPQASYLTTDREISFMPLRVAWH
jgi:hypothetical protein